MYNYFYHSIWLRMPARILTYKKGTAVVHIKKDKAQRHHSVHHELARAVMIEALGFAPYERHILEMLRLNRDR